MRSRSFRAKAIQSRNIFFRSGADFSLRLGNTPSYGVLSTSGFTARVWDAASRKEIAVLRGHEGPVRSAADDARAVGAEGG